MDLFYIENFHSKDTVVSLSTEESHPISKVLRKSTGSQIRLTDGKGQLISGEIADSRKRQLKVAVTKIQKFDFPALNQLALGVAVIRPNRMDWIVEKATELGIKTIVPLICQNNSYSSIKQIHLKKIAISALKQSQQTYLPDITKPMELESWLIDNPNQFKSRYIADPAGNSLPPGDSASPVLFPCRIAVGPEGGFTDQELQLAGKLGYSRLRLGNTILRTETAAIAAIAILKSAAAF
jgi:16S rRNA (uracil1498-N3)-methyltransferase